MLVTPARGGRDVTLHDERTPRGGTAGGERAFTSAHARMAGEEARGVWKSQASVDDFGPAAVEVRFDLIDLIYLF